MANALGNRFRNAVLAVYIRFSRPHNADFWDHPPPKHECAGHCLNLRQLALVSGFL